MGASPSVIEQQTQIQIKLPDYEPSERQAKFHMSVAFETFFGGAAGPGKSTALCGEAINSCIRYPGHRVFFFRKTLKNLRQGTLPAIMKQLGPYIALPDNVKATLPNGRPLTIKYNGSDSIFRFSNGSFIQFAYLNTTADIYNYSSIEIHELLIDELTQFTEDEYNFLKTRVRADDNRPLRIKSASNPGDIGHNWVKERFLESLDPNITYIPEVPYEEVFEDPDTGETYVRTRVFIPAFVTDNPNHHIQVEYKRNLNSIKDPQLRQALLKGDWNTFMGRVYTEWNKDLHVITGPLPVDLDVCDKYIGFDWGYHDPAVATWLAYAPENEDGVRRLYAYREIHEVGKTPQWWAKTIANIIKDEAIEYMILPHDCFSHLGGNRTIASVFDEHDVPYVRADSMNHAAKMHRIALMHQMLSLADDGLPYLQFHEFCLNNISTIPTLPYSKTRPEEIDDKAADHDFDSTTYALMVISDAEAYIVNSSREPDPDEYNRNNLVRALRDTDARISGVIG
jgi:phage terminase large subunit